MTGNYFEVPELADLIDLPVEVTPMKEVGVVAITAHAGDGDTATITWDELAGSVTIQWKSDGVDRVRLERELASKVSIIQNDGAVEFRSWMRGSDLGGQLLVRVADKVSISDAILRM